jgi:hypothetical protein
MTNVPAPARDLDPLREGDEAELDQLVPPPGPAWRRVAGWLAFVGALVGIGWLWTSGTVTPRLENQGWSYGGEGPVHLTVTLTNPSRVAVELVDGPRPRDGLRLLGYQVQALAEDGRPVPSAVVADPFPARVEPGELLIVTVWYEVTDCGALEADRSTGDRIDVQARIADGPLGAVTRTRWIDAPSSIDGDGFGHEDGSWTVAMTRYACP